MTRARVLAIAGSDSGGGAGIQADIKTIAALGAYAMTAVTAVTVQDTTGVHAVHPVPVDLVARQIDRVLADLGADAVKTGMLGDDALIRAVAARLASHVGARGGVPPIVVDPVMVAKGGAPLLPAASVATLREVLFPLATIVTPNLPEAAMLVGFPVDTPDAMRDACAVLRARGARAVLLKGGHLPSSGPGAAVVDLLATADGIEPFTDPRIDTVHTHGTGCTLASAVATGLGQGLSLRDAVRRARAYVRAAIAAAPGFGAGHGPLGHWAADPAPAGPPVRRDAAD